jgi:dihydrodipicolinate synthase/N-acetylneuraminate lyase
MGEGSEISDEARNAFVEMALDQAADNLTIYVSAVDSSYYRMRERALRYAAMGAPCVVLGVPPGVSTASAVNDVKRVADLCRVPCAYYDVPARTGTTLTLHEIVDILSHANIVAMKDSSSNALTAYSITAPQYRVPGVALLDGCEYRTAFSQAQGYDGVLHGGGVLTGHRVRTIWNLASCGRLREAIELDRENALFLATIYNRCTRPVQNTIGQKYALKLLGIFDDSLVAIDQSLDEASRARIARAVDADLKWLVQAGSRQDSVATLAE